MSQMTDAHSVWAEVYALIPREASTVPEGWVVLDSAGAYRLETDDHDEARSIARDLGTTPLVVARPTASSDIGRSSMPESTDADR